MQQVTQPPSCSVTFTDAAASKIAQFLTAYDEPDLAVRIRVEAGGCAGPQCHLSFEKPRKGPAADRGDATPGNDSVVSFGDFSALIDPASVPFLDGATIDYIGNPSEYDFEVENLNARDGCVCGDDCR